VARASRTFTNVVPQPRSGQGAIVAAELLDGGRMALFSRVLSGDVALEICLLSNGCQLVP